MRLPDPDQREFSGRLTATGRWSSRALERQIGVRLFARFGFSRRVTDLTESLPIPGGDQALAPTDVFKDPSSEQDLAAAILRTSERFLLELGTDCCTPPHDLLYTCFTYRWQSKGSPGRAA